MGFFKPKDNNLPFFLASAPVEFLDRAKELVEARGGEYAAGDKDDIFNSSTLDNQESWKVGWKGKVEMAINMLKKHNKGKKIICLAIAGGPACDWERGELRNTFCKNHPELKIKTLGDLEDLETWLDKNHPQGAATSIATSMANASLDSCQVEKIMLLAADVLLSMHQTPGFLIHYLAACLPARLSELTQLVRQKDIADRHDYWNPFTASQPANQPTNQPTNHAHTHICTHAHTHKRTYILHTHTYIPQLIAQDLFSLGCRDIRSSRCILCNSRCTRNISWCKVIRMDLKG